MIKLTDDHDDDEFMSWSGPIVRESRCTRECYHDYDDQGVFYSLLKGKSSIRVSFALHWWWWWWGWLDLILPNCVFKSPNSKTFSLHLAIPHIYILETEPLELSIFVISIRYIPTNQRRFADNTLEYKQKESSKAFLCSFINVGAIGVSVLYWEKMVEHMKRFFTQALQNIFFQDFIFIYGLSILPFALVGTWLIVLCML